MTKSGPARGQARQEGTPSPRHTGHGDALSSRPDQPRQPPAPVRDAAGASPSWASGLTSTTPVAGPAGYFLADVPNRVLACAIDLILLSVVGVLISLPVAWLLGGLVVGHGELNLAAFVVSVILHVAAGYLYFVRPWVSLQASVGLYLLGMRVADERDGRAIGSRQGTLRWALLGIPATLVTIPVFVASIAAWLLFVVGMIWLVVLLLSMSVSPTKQGLHDRRAHTVVLKAPRRRV